jgi:Kef-type K+ transport system membrane component KefB
MREWVHDGLSKMGYSLFVPLFFIYVGIQSNFHSISFIPLALLIGFVSIAIVSKVLGCGMGAFLCNFKPRESLTVGVGMISRGEVALITGTIGLQAKLIDQSLFSSVVLVALITTLITPLLLNLLYIFQPSAPVSQSLAAEAVQNDVGEIIQS